MSNQFDNRLYRVYKDSTGCQSRLATGLTAGRIVYTAGCQTGLTTGLFTRCSRMSNRLYNRFCRFDNRLCRVNGVLQIAKSFLLYVSPSLWNQIRISFYEPHPDHVSYDSTRLAYVRCPRSLSPFSVSICPALFLSRLETYTIQYDKLWLRAPTADCWPA